MKSNQNGEAPIAAHFIKECRAVLVEGMRKIDHCLGQIDETQFWWRPRPEMNSIANLMLHLSGNLRQWIVAGVGGAQDTRNRPKEFGDRSKRSKAEVRVILKKVVADADAAMAALKMDQLLQLRKIQGYEVTAIGAIMRTIPHFRGHIQEIIHMTREQLGDKYRFDFVPKGAEQESASGVGV